MSRPSRTFLIQQATLNALDLERREYRFDGTVQEYARQRFGKLPRERWAGVYGFASMVRTQFEKFVDQYEGE
jgi:hypothetical protein